jgi:hypothetical protein
VSLAKSRFIEKWAGRLGLADEAREDMAKDLNDAAYGRWSSDGHLRSCMISSVYELMVLSGLEPQHYLQATCSACGESNWVWTGCTNGDLSQFVPDGFKCRKCGKEHPYEEDEGDYIEDGEEAPSGYELEYEQ